MKRWLAAALIAWAPGALAQWAELSFVDPGLRWRTLETAAFHVHFAERHRTQARRVAGIAEAVLPRVTALLRWKPASRIQLVVLDSADFANGFASPVPFSFTMVFLSPPDEGELMQNREWLELVLAHELFHIVHLDMARRAPLVLRRVFGRLPFIFPNVLQPSWIMEGLAVHAESEPELSRGRLGNAHFEGMMRAETSRGLRSLAEVNAGGRGFPLNRDYLYGGYFFAFLQERHGFAALTDFIENYSDNVIPFRVNSNPVAVTGKNMDELWAEYQGWLAARFPARASPALEGDVLERAFSLSAPALGRDGTRWYIRHDGYRRAQLVAQPAGGKPEAVRAVEQDARLAVGPDGTALLSQPDICGNYNYYYDLYRIDADGAAERLGKCTRSRFAAQLADGRVAVLRVENGEAQVAILGGDVLYRAAPGEALTGIAAENSSVVVTSLRGGRWSLIGIGEGRSQVLLSDAAVKHSPRVDERGEVFFIADYGKVFNVWSLGRDGSLSRWTDAAHGIREMSAPTGGELLLTTIEADGAALRLLRLPTQPLERVTAPAPGPSEDGELPVIDAPDRAYSPWYSLAPRSWLPLITIADGAVALGATTFGQDALAVHQYAISPQYEVTQRELLGSIAYIYDRRHLLLADRVLRVKSTSGDGDDEEIRSYTINERAQWVSTWRSVALDRRFYWGLGGALEKEKLHERDSATVVAQDERVLALVAGFDSRRQFLLSEGPSQGLQVRAFAETSRGLHAAYAGDVYRIDARAHLPIGKTVLSLRWNEAWGEADAEPFQLGGSDTDLPTLVPILNQREFALRGYTSGAPGLVGNRARVGTVEWRVPLKDVDRHLMVPPVGLNRVSVNAFLDVGDAWPRGSDADYRTGIGIEVMSEIRAGYLFGADLRLGVARGLDEEGKGTAYLRIGRSF